MPDHKFVCEPITRWLQRMDSTDNTTLSRLFRFYHGQLLTVARAALRNHNCRVVDEDDLVAEVLGDFFRDGQSGDLPVMESREDALRMLWSRLQKRARNVVRDANRQCRGSGRVRGDSVFRELGADHERGFDQLPTTSPPVDAHLIFLEELGELQERFLGCLSPSLVGKAELWLQGRTPLQIAENAGISLSSVYRKLGRILERFEQVFPGTRPEKTL